MKLTEGINPQALTAVVLLLVFAVTAGALMWFGFICGCRYAEEKTMAAVYKAQLDKAQELMRSDLAIANGYKDGRPEPGEEKRKKLSAKRVQ